MNCAITIGRESKILYRSKRAAQHSHLPISNRQGRRALDIFGAVVECATNYGKHIWSKTGKGRWQYAQRPAGLKIHSR